MMVRLSVIIPGYNTPEAWWKRCVDSVLKAIGPNDEVVLVDDGSKESLKLSKFEGLQGLDERVHLISKTNGGLGSARNAALEVAQGEYVTFVDSDDEVRAESFRRCIETLEASKSDICLYGVEVRWVNEGLLKRDIPDNRIYGQLLPSDVKDLSDRCLLNYACNKVYRKSFLDQHRLRFDVNGMPCEDIIFNLECICAGARWASVDSVGYVYYRVSGGRTILSSYRPTNEEGLRAGARAWQKYSSSLAPADVALFEGQAVVTERDILLANWRNIWLPGSPYSLYARWRWLKENRFDDRVKMFAKMLLFGFLRRHLYVKPIRRWHVRRMYPYAESF